MAQCLLVDICVFNSGLSFSARPPRWKPTDWSWQVTTTLVPSRPVTLSTYGSLQLHHLQLGEACYCWAE